jgi:hypothetical protein
MALTNYSDLQTAIASEVNVSTGGLPTATIQDCITRAEAKVNRKTRLREAEQLAYATLSSSSRFLDVPTDMMELLNLRIKLATASDSSYKEVNYIAPERIHQFYESAGDKARWVYTMRDQLEFQCAPSSDHTVMMHYFKKWDIATDTTNWLLTNFPDAYLYGALAECEMYLKNDERIVLWKSLFEQALAELNELSHRNRDDAQLDTSDVACLSNRSVYNVVTG